MSKITKQQFSEILWGYYDEHGRHDLLWRTKISPYRIVVSEIMLQQTQVARVEEYFQKWMQDFPDWQSLARASLRDILLHWQGLGYNRRGTNLHRLAQTVVGEYAGVLPREKDMLLSLPGIGPYTAGAVLAFAYNQADVFLETNIRTVLIHHFFPGHQVTRKIDDGELKILLKKIITSDKRAQENPREFYWALMDYGSHLKKTVGNLNKQSKTYTKQSRFEGSRRQLRAGILRYVLHNGPVSEKKIIEQSLSEKDLVRELLGELIREGSLTFSNKKYQV